MHIISRIGKPLQTYSLQKQEFIKGQTLDGFTLPFTVFDSLDGLFRRFGLWQSNTGICLEGLDHIPFRIGKHTMVTDKPVLVGDKVCGESICESICEYRPMWQRWSCSVTYGIPEKPQGQAQEITLLNTYIDTDHKIATTLMDLIQDLLTHVLPQCQDSNGIPINCALSWATWQEISLSCQQKIHEIINKEKQDLWH